MVYRSGPRWTTLQRLEKDLPISFEQDSNGMSSHRSKRTLCNGYSHHSSLSLATLECHAQLVTAGQSYQTGSSTMRWGKCQKAQHNSASVRDCLRECGFVANLRQTQTPLPSRKCALELPTQFIGQRNCRAPVCVVDQQSSSVRELQPSGQTEANQHTFDKCCRLKSNCGSNLEPTCIKKKPMGHVAEDDDGPRSTQVIFSTEVPQEATLECLKGSSDLAKGDDSKNRSDAMGEGLSGQTYIFSSKKTQRVLQDQIRRVVVNLEEVLRGLKDVHLEMKEVVQQIDLLTSNIDLGEEDAEDTCGGSSRTGPASEEASKKICSLRDNSGRPDSSSHNPSTVPRASKRQSRMTRQVEEELTRNRGHLYKARWVGIYEPDGSELVMARPSNDGQLGEFGVEFTIVMGHWKRKKNQQNVRKHMNVTQKQQVTRQKSIQQLLRKKKKTKKKKEKKEKNKKQKDCCSPSAQSYCELYVIRRWEIKETVSVHFFLQ